mmetsp:Transcript_4406/g.9998  ORF Transcript_4406/g.9998 Transcript_4406/m.9998 type:complete len:201 (-) Transcript_4406:27-629(-)
MVARLIWLNVQLWVSAVSPHFMKGIFGFLSGVRMRALAPCVNQRIVADCVGGQRLVSCFISLPHFSENPIRMLRSTIIFTLCPRIDYCIVRILIWSNAQLWVCTVSSPHFTKNAFGILSSLGMRALAPCINQRIVADCVGGHTLVSCFISLPHFSENPIRMLRSTIIFTLCPRIDYCIVRILIWSNAQLWVCTVSSPHFT